MVGRTNEARAKTQNGHLVPAGPTISQHVPTQPSEPNAGNVSRNQIARVARSPVIIATPMAIMMPPASRRRTRPAFRKAAARFMKPVRNTAARTKGKPRPSE
jgi:hypothetical protein